MLSPRPESQTPDLSSVTSLPDRKARHVSAPLLSFIVEQLSVRQSAACSRTVGHLGRPINYGRAATATRLAHGWFLSVKTPLIK